MTLILYHKCLYSLYTFSQSIDCLTLWKTRIDFFFEWTEGVPATKGSNQYIAWYFVLLHSLDSGISSLHSSFSRSEGLHSLLHAAWNASCEYFIYSDPCLHVQYTCYRFWVIILIYGGHILLQRSGCKRMKAELGSETLKYCSQVLCCWPTCSSLLGLRLT